jgi:hypothetical protein
MMQEPEQHPHTEHGAGNEAPHVSFELKARVEKLVQQTAHDPVHVSRWGYSAFVPDVLHFHMQVQALEYIGAPLVAGLFRNSPGEKPTLLVPVRAPDLSNVTRSYDDALTALDQSGVPLEKIRPSEARSALVDRLAEFIAARSATVPGLDTIVHSNRTGDPVFYCNGYFTSTATAFGTSTPAAGALEGGRYSFGVVDAGTRKFDNTLWTCPNLNVRLPLP